MRKRKWNHFVAGVSAVTMVASLCTTVVPQTVNKVEAATSCQMESLDRGLVAVKSGNGIFELFTFKKASVLFKTNSITSIKIIA